MNNDPLKESSLFGQNEGEETADTRFVVGPNQRLRSTRQESLDAVANLPEDDADNISRVMGRLRVRPKGRRTKIAEHSTSVAPVTFEEAEQAILAAFAEDPKSTDTQFLSEPTQSSKPSVSRKSSAKNDETRFQSGMERAEDAFHTAAGDDLEGIEPPESFSSLGDEESVPTLESNSTAISSQLGSVESSSSVPPSTGRSPFKSLTSMDLLEKLETVRCTVCDEKNLEAASYCNRCGSLLNYGLRRPFGFAEISKEPTALSWTPNKELRAFLIAINDDGTEGKRIPIEFLETIIGRETDSPFPTDSFLSPKHAKLIVQNGQLYIQDLDSLNGTFIKLRQERLIQSGDTFLMGRQVLSFEEVPTNNSIKLRAPDGTRKMGSPATDSSYRLLQIGIGNVLQNVYCLPKAGAQLGRERGDIIFPHDKFMSSRHAQIYRRNDGEFVLADLNSSNGTWIKIWELTPLETQDYIFMGQQLFRVLIDQ